MTAPNSGRFQRQSGARVGQRQHDTIREFLVAVERLEQAVGSLGRLLADHAQTIAHIGTEGVRSDAPDNVPSVEEISEVFGLPRAGVVRLLQNLVRADGDVIPDRELGVLIRCSILTLKVYACEARAALNDLGIERGVRRERGRGYYMRPAEIAKLIDLCEAAKPDRRRSQ